MIATQRYSHVAIALHWLVGMALLVSFCVGLYMSDLPFSPQRLRLYNWHKWAGITILTLSLIRLIWRLTHRPPAASPMPAWQRHTAHLTHHGLYFLFLAVPLVGWAYSSAAGFQVVMFGLLPLPDFVPVDKQLADALKGLHKALAFAMALLTLGHVGAALKHQFIDHDDLLTRMWPPRPPNPSPPTPTSNEP